MQSLITSRKFLPHKLSNISCKVLSVKCDFLRLHEVVACGLALIIMHLFNVVFHLQGRYEILSLSGSFLLSENDGQRSRTGGLSVSLSGTDGRVLGGGVAGLLTAASPVQVLLAFYMHLQPM